MHDQLPAYFDGELDTAQGRTFEEHLTACPDCTHELAALREMRDSLQDESLRHRPPTDLEERIRTGLRLAQPAPVTARRWPARLLAVAALAAAVLVGVGLTLAVRTTSGEVRLAQEVAANHARSLLADHLFDVASTDQHTVKPWFQGRTDFSPPVTDFKDQGFPLAGGRLDFLDGRPAAALVYRHRQHVINLFVWPSAEGGKNDTKMMTRRGYNLAHWTAGGLNFWAVSDLNADDLAEFARLVRDGVR